LRHGVLVNCYTFSVSITVSDIFILQLLVSVTVNCGVIFQLFCHFSYSYS